MDCSPPGFSVHVKPVVQVSPGLSNGCGIICYILDAFSFKKTINLFLAALSLCCCAWASSSCSKQGWSPAGARGLLLAVAPPVVECRLSSCKNLVAPQQVESSWPRDRTHVPCTGRQILNHWTTREVQGNLVVRKKSLCIFICVSEKFSSVGKQSTVLE